MAVSVYEQQAGEHIQMFAWKVESAMRLARSDGEVPDSLILHRVMLGLHPSVKAVIKPRPQTLDQLFCFGEILDQLIPPSDPYWRTIHPDEQPLVTVTVDNDAYRPVSPSPLDITCYRCTEKGHYASVCKKKRVQPPNRKRGQKRRKPALRSVRK